MFNLNDRRIIEGPRNNLMQIRPVKHTFARDALKNMMNNTWSPEEVDLSDDARAWAIGTLTSGEKESYKKALAFLSNLDGIQLNNLMNNINQHVTSPEVNQCLVRQAWDEALHVESYAQMIESIGFDPEEVYWMFETDAMLAVKNEHIMAQSRILGDHYSARNFVLAIAANIALEGIYFYSGFLTFYTLARLGKMLNSAKMIKLIQRDEVCHLYLHVNIFKALRRERPELFDPQMAEDINSIFRQAVDHESAWGAYIISEGVLGLNDQVVRCFVEYLADERLKVMGMAKQYGTDNPVKWFDRYSQVSDNDQNFFETKVDSYDASLTW